MSTRSQTPRRYDASGRRAQARRTREEIVAAARGRFLADGYAATTMGAVAESAGVSVETVYGGFAGKAGLLRAVLDASVRGDAEATPLEQREVITAIEAEPDPRRKLERYGAFLAEANPRLAPVTRLLREAAASDPALAQLRDRHAADRLGGMTRFAAHLSASGALRPGVSRAEARDVLWTLNSTDVYDLLVTGRGWSAKRYGAWVAEQLAAALV